LNEYDIKDLLDVRFASSSAKISPADQESLEKLALDAVAGELLRESFWIFGTITAMTVERIF
jgi:hypothetical protein